jgi:hypothetical protein
MRDDAHRLLDTLTDQELPFVLRLLRSLHGKPLGDARTFKDLLRAMPSVGDDADFERPQDQGRTPAEWDT